MSDIFREIDEEVRREQFQRLWQRYGVLIVALCVVVVLAVAGWRIYEWQQGQKATEVSAQFEAAVALANEGKNKEAIEAFAKIASDGTPTYRMFAQFREGAAQAAQDPKAAVAVYDRLAADSGVGLVFRDLATLEAGTLLVDSAPYADIKQRLEPLTAADRTFRHSARAMLALAAWHAKDAAAMRHWADMILADADTPAGARGQVQMLLALSDSGQKG